MPAPYSADLRWRVIWFFHVLQNSKAEASFFLGVCERTAERYISKFLVNGGVKPEPVGRSYGDLCKNLCKIMKKSKTEYKLIMKKLPCRFLYTFYGRSLAVNGEIDKILGVVVRFSFP